MKKEDVYLIAINENLFRPHIPAKIIGVKQIKPSDDLMPRLCYSVKYSDGKRDWLPISDFGKTYKICTFNEIIKNQTAK